MLKSVAGDLSFILRTSSLFERYLDVEFLSNYYKKSKYLVQLYSNGGVALDILKVWQTKPNECAELDTTTVGLNN